MNELIYISIEELLKKYPYAEDFFISIGIKSLNHDLSVEKFVESLTFDELQHLSLSQDQIADGFIDFMEKMEELKHEQDKRISSITILGGHNKSGIKEDVKLEIKPGDIVCIVGPTGSGKSRLLADIECLAQGDTPTGRQVLVNNEIPDSTKRFSIEYKLVAQLSQNMNFVMDLTVGEFVKMHAESRMVENIDETVKSIVLYANELAGEKFSIDTSLTQLSGGQSRALMIADTALLSSSPIVLIDEIENAGVDRKKALEILVNKEKIVFMSTHDPILALMGHKRIVIKNGGIHKVLETSELEKNSLYDLQRFDDKMHGLRNILRSGHTIDFDVKEYFQYAK